MSQWSHDQQWEGDPKPIAREIRAQMIYHDEHQADILTVFGKSRNAWDRRLRGLTKWRRWELEELAAHWKIKPSDLTGENNQNHTSVSTDP